MKQRLALAIALLADPPLLVLDEPTANLDARAREDLLRFLAEVKAAGKTLLFSSHRPDEVMTLADRVLVMEKGRIVSEQTPEAFVSQAGGGLVLRLHLPGEWVEPAMTTLAAHGFAVGRNGAGIQVSVAPYEKARPISLLAQAGIPVNDFDMHHTSGGNGDD
jgi:ABC-type multidrug transport system ATPase subunit